jgi:hypothetical protein
MTERAGDVLASFALVTQAFASDREVTSGGRGFGSGGLKVNGKLFALVSSRDEFVVKLPQQRVSELVATGAARYFDAGRGRPMKEWAAIDLTGGGDPVALAQEAHRFVRGGQG